MKSSRNQTSTTTSAPPSYLQPYLNTAAGAATDQYQAGGTPVTPFSNETNQALTAATNRATAGSPVNAAASDYATKTLNGGFMGSNPYLQQAYDKAAGAVTNSVQSSFSRAGRNPNGPDAAANAQLGAAGAGGGYNDLAASIYGGDYENERNRQQQLAPLAGGIANQDYVDIGQLANVGAQREALSQEQAGQPAQTLNNYLGQLNGLGGGYGTTSATTPMNRNLLGGAAAGANLGSAWGPYGSLLGGLAGGVLGG